MDKIRFRQSGFTLLELLIVIAIIAIITSVAFVALDPLTRFRDARDAARFTDVNAILSAAKVDQVDNGGNYLTAISSLTADKPYMIGTATTGCNVSTCDVSIGANDCVDLTALVTEGYLPYVPISPNGQGTWSSSLTGYYIQRNSNNSLTVGACESENTSSISATR